MTDVETMIKALRSAWIPRLFAPGRKNWKTIPDYYLGRVVLYNSLFLHTSVKVVVCRLCVSVLVGAGRFFFESHDQGKPYTPASNSQCSLNKITDNAFVQG